MFFKPIIEGKLNMRMSEAIPHGRIAELYNPEMFRNYDEVIVFTKEEF